MTQVDPKNIIDQADDLLKDINRANLKFVDKTNQINIAINQSFQAVNQLNKELEKEEFDALEEMDGQILEYLEENEK
ncbi:MAG: hypothetical protein AAB969_02085 [Patescibacteria group bacterium]